MASYEESVQKMNSVAQETQETHLAYKMVLISSNEEDILLSDGTKAPTLTKRVNEALLNNPEIKTQEKEAQYIVDESGISQQKINSLNETPYTYGAVGDGTLHKVEEWYTVGNSNYRGYADLASVKLDYPFITDKDFSADQAAILKLASLTKDGATLNLSKGHYIVKPVNDSACLNSTPVLYSGFKSETIIEMLSDTTPDPNTTVWWDIILFSGTSNSFGGVKNVKFVAKGGARNNCGSIAIRGGASNKQISGNIFDSAIASSVISEYDTENRKSLGNKIFDNDFISSNRHATYISGTLGDDVFNNRYHGYAREAIIIRSATPNIDNNTFYGNSSNTTRACITVAKKSDGSAYADYSGLKINNNKAYNLYTAFFDGNGQSCHINDSEISNNEIRQVDDASVTQHVFMLYCSNRNNLTNNKIFGARKRAFVLGGCSDNDLSGTVAINTNGAAESAGAIHLNTYTDFDNITYASSRNKFDKVTAVDNRSGTKQYAGVYIGGDCLENIVTNPNISGFTGQKIAIVDGAKSQKIGSLAQQVFYSKSALPTGTNTASSMTLIGNSLPCPVNRTGFVSKIRIDLSQQTLTGTITCRLLKNGNTFTNVVFTANSTIRYAETYFTVDQLAISSGDILTATIESNAITSNSTSLDVSFNIVLCS